MGLLAENLIPAQAACHFIQVFKVILGQDIQQDSSNNNYLCIETFSCHPKIGTKSYINIVLPALSI